MNVIDTIPKKYWSQFYANPQKKGNFAKDSEEVNTLYLTKLQQEWDYLLIDKHEYWADLPIYNKFPKLKNFISNLPFENTGRMFLIFSKIKKICLRKEKLHNQLLTDFILIMFLERMVP